MDIDIRRAMSKSPPAVVREALKAGRALPTYSGKYSKHDFTQAQLFAVLTLKTFLKTDYRGVVQMLHDWSDLRRVLRLKKVPHYSTLCYAEQRLLKKGLAGFCCNAPSGAPVGAA